MSDAETPRVAGLIGAVRLLLIAVLVIGVLELARRSTSEPIQRARDAARMQALEVVLPGEHFDNMPVEDAIWIDAAPLGPGRHRVYRARRGDQPSALIIEATAPGGYAGPIELLVAIDARLRIVAVRVTEHRETPGLGDRIDRSIDDWIDTFTGRSIGDPPPDDWAVRKDGGSFDEFAGATVTPRAVVEAVHGCLEFATEHAADLYAAPTGATLRR